MTYFSGQTAGLLFAGTGLSILFGLCRKAYLEAQKTTFPTPDELAKTGISFFKRPSDGGKLEYFEYGAKDDPNAVVWIFIHGALTTGDFLKIFPDFDERMRELNVRVVAPTMPGWGLSDGYEPLFEITKHEWLDRWRMDALALIDSLNVERFWVSGMSLGGPPALALADYAPQSRLLGVTPLISTMWTHGDFDQKDHLSFGDYAILSILANQYIGTCAAKLLRYFVLKQTKEDFLKHPMVPPGVTWSREMWGMDLQRALRYQLSGQIQCNRLVANVPTTDRPLINWSVFTEEVPVYIFYGETDETVKPAVATFAATKLPWAKLMPFPGGHLEMDIFQVANTLFGNK